MAESLRHIVIVGPESTGKSTLAKSLAEHFDTEWVPEFLREFFVANDGKIVEADVNAVVEGQMQNSEELIMKANEYLVWDTNPLQTYIYQMLYFDRVPAWLDSMIVGLPADLYLLLSPDIPWEADPQRDKPQDRDKIFYMIEKELWGRKLNYEVVEGDRMAGALDALNRI